MTMMTEKPIDPQIALMLAADLARILTDSPGATVTIKLIEPEPRQKKKKPRAARAAGRR
jgi:hypothetical protein